MVDFFLFDCKAVVMQAAGQAPACHISAAVAVHDILHYETCMPASADTFLTNHSVLNMAQGILLNSMCLL